MLSNRLYRLIGFAWPVLAGCGICKYDFNSNSRTFVPFPRNHNKVTVVTINTLFSWGWMIFHAVRVYLSYLEHDISTQVFVIACIIAMCLAMLCSMFTMWWADDFFSLVNSVMIFLNRMNADFMPKFDRNKSTYIKIVDLAIHAITGLMITLSLVTSLSFILFPALPTLLGSVLPYKWYFFPLIYLFPIYTATCLYLYVLPIVVAAFILGTIFIPFVVRELKLGRKNYWTDESIRQPANLRIVYRTVQIIQVRINKLAGKLLIPFQTGVTLIFVFSSYVVIKYREDMAMIPFCTVFSWTWCAPIGWTLVLTMGGFLHSNGLKIINSWKMYQSMKGLSCFEKNEMSKFRQSAKPIMICFGKMFIMKRVSVMVFIRGLSRGLIRTLLTLNKLS